MRLEGKVAFISGGSRGMGAVEAIMFAAEGACVAIGDVREEEARKVVERINDTGGRAIFLPLDVTSEDQWNSAIAATVSEFGELDILVNNAGIGATSMIEDTTVEQWDRVMDINAKGVFLGTRYAIPEMRKAGGGSIINISSQLGLVGMHDSSPAYQSSKGAVRLLTKSTAIQYASEGIRCNSVHPGPVVTVMTEDSRRDAEVYRSMEARVPLGRYGEADEVAYGVVYLASDDSSFVTGSELVIDGGWTAQ